MASETGIDFLGVVPACFWPRGMRAADDCTWAELKLITFEVFLKCYSGILFFGLVLVDFFGDGFCSDAWKTSLRFDLIPTLLSIFKSGSSDDT